jgi:PIN domain nuclease of toxin-antitoxin system
MKALVDTHALLWWLFDDRRLSARARQVLEDGANEILVSSASGWEIMTKHRLGKLPHAGEAVRDLRGAV